LSQRGRRPTIRSTWWPHNYGVSAGSAWTTRCGRRRSCGFARRCRPPRRHWPARCCPWLRVRKSGAESDALGAAGAAIDRVHARMGEWLRAGRTEAEVARDIAAAIVAEGHRQVDFVIVASGPNSASPHHDSGERVIEAGDAVVVDIGGTIEAGYCSDETRTYAVGEPSAEFRDAYAVLQRAQQAAVRRVGPGVTSGAIDAAA